MKYLEKYGFNPEDIEKFEDNTADVMLDALHDNRKLVGSNLKYLEELGVKNVIDIFNGYYELFLLDHSNFTSIFNKYDQEDLVEKLAKNPAIIEYL